MPIGWLMTAVAEREAFRSSSMRDATYFDVWLADVVSNAKSIPPVAARHGEDRPERTAT
jgi:hypothetical protein